MNHLAKVAEFLGGVGTSLCPPLYKWPFLYYKHEVHLDVHV